MSMQEALAKLRAHLKAHPDDLTGWLLLARSEVGLGRYREGAEAYGRAAELSSDRPDIAADWGEAQVMAAGSVTPEAARRSRPDCGTRRAHRNRAIISRSRSWSRATGAARCRTGPISPPTSPPDAEWQTLLRQRIAEVAKAEGIDPASVMPSAAASHRRHGTRRARRNRACRRRKPSRRPRRRPKEPLPRSAAR